MFLTPRSTGSSANDCLDDQPIVSIEIEEVLGDNYYGDSTGLEQDAFVVCFAGGTLIDTEQGQVDVARLSVGDRVRTMDNGYQEIRWIGGRQVRAVGNIAPIRIAAGALGAGLPERDLRVSPQHRILVRSKIAKRMFGSFEVLIPAKKLLGLRGVTSDEARQYVTYWHFLFDHHEIVFSNGAATESLFTGVEALKAVGAAAQSEIRSLFPELIKKTRRFAPARYIVSGKKQARLIDRHRHNTQAVYQR